MVSYVDATDAFILLKKVKKGEVTVEDYMLHCSMERTQAYSRFAKLCAAAENSTKGWGKVWRKGSRKVLEFYLDEMEQEQLYNLAIEGRPFFKKKLDEAQQNGKTNKPEA
jgi:hypothetical protein